MSGKQLGNKLRSNVNEANTTRTNSNPTKDFETVDLGKFSLSTNTNESEIEIGFTPYTPDINSDESEPKSRLNILEAQQENGKVVVNEEEEIFSDPEIDTNTVYNLNNIRYVDLTINSNKKLSVLDNLNNYEYFRGFTVKDKHVNDFYNKDSFDLNQEIKFLHSITCDINYEPLDDIQSFRTTKLEIINDISIKLENQFLSAASKTNLLEFFDDNSKNNFNLKSDMISNLQNGLVKLDSFINENNYPNNILSLFEEGNGTSEFVGKILNESLTTELIYEEKFNYKSNLTISQTSEYPVNIDFTQENIISYIQRNVGSIIQEDIYPFINSQDRLNSSSFIIQLISNIGFSMYGLYPTILLQNNDIDNDSFIYQDLKSTQPSIIVNFFKDYESIYNFNIFSNINVNSKSFDARLYIKNDLFIYNEKEYTFDDGNLPQDNSAFIEVNIQNEVSERLSRKNINYENFLKFIFGEDRIETRKELGSYNLELSGFNAEENLNNDLYDIVLFRIFSLKILTDRISIDFMREKFNGIYTNNRIYQYSVEELKTLNSDDSFLDIFEILKFLHNNKSFIENDPLLASFFNRTLYSQSLALEVKSKTSELYFPSYSETIINNNQSNTISFMSSNPNDNPLISIPSTNQIFSNFFNSYSFEIKVNILTFDLLNTNDIVLTLQKISLPKSYIQIYHTYDFFNKMTEGNKQFYFNSIVQNVYSGIRQNELSSPVSYEEKNSFLNSISREIKALFVDKLKKSLEKIIFDSFLNDSFMYINENQGFFGSLFKENIYYSLCNLLSISLVDGNEEIVDDFYNTFKRTFNQDITLELFKSYLLRTTEQFSLDTLDGEKNLFSKDILNTEDNITQTSFNEINRGREDVIDNFITNLSSEEPMENNGYLYYSKGFDKPLVNSYKKDTLKLSDLNKQYTINSYELSYLVDKLIKKIKLYTLENNNIDYSIFKDITDKISKMRINALEVPTLSENSKKEFSVISEGDELFDFITTKDTGNNKFYTDFDFTSNNDYKNFNINDTISLVLENKDLLKNNNEEFLENFLTIVSRYYYNNTINSSSQFLSSCIQRVTNDLNNNENSNENKILQFLYFSNFELGNKISDFESKNEITKRFIKKSISRRVNASDNLKNSDLGFIFDINSVDMDKLSDFNREKILSETVSEETSSDEVNDQTSDQNYINDTTVSEVADYFESLFDTNIEYKKIKNAIFNNNISTDNNYEFYYIPTSSINAKSGNVNLHSSFSKLPNFHQSFLSTVEECGFLFDCYTLTFPYTSFVKRNIPFKIPADFLGKVKNQSFNNETLVKNYCTFNTNINSKIASAYINFCIKNERKELTTISRKKITDNFDQISNIESSSFRKILNDINVMLTATTNIDDLNFEDTNDIDKFIDDNKFIIGLSSSIISVYSEIYNNMFKEKQLEAFWNNLQGDANIIQKTSENSINFKIEIDSISDLNISDISGFDFNKTGLGFVYNENTWNIQNFKLNNDYDSLNDNTKPKGYNDILSKNLIKLTFSDFNQSLSFDILSGYLNKKLEFEKNEELEDEILNEDLKSFYNISNLDKKTTSRFFNLFYLNTVSKELSRKFYYNKDFYSNFISNQEDSENIKSHYLTNINNLFNVYKEKEKFLNDNLINTENFNLKNNNILTFGITNKFIKSLSPRSIIKIDIINGENSYETFYFSPLLTSVYPFFNDSIFLDTHVGLYDIHSNINKRYLIANKDDIFKVKNYRRRGRNADIGKTTSGYFKSFFGSNLSNRKILILEKSLENIIVSNKLNNLLNLIFNFNIDVEDFYKNLQLNNNTTSIDLLNIVNTISAFNFKKFSNISKRYFNNNTIVDNENNIAILPGFEEMINNKTSIFETLTNINKIYSIEEINNSFREKVFYDFYHIHLRSGINKYENIKITVDSVEL